MFTTAALKSYTTKDLAQIAKKQGVPGWHSMRKDQLVRALVRSAKSKAASRDKRAGQRRVASAGKATGAKGRAGLTPAALKNGTARSSRTPTAASSHSGGSRQRASRKSKPRSPQTEQKLREAQVLRERMKDLAYSARNGEHPEVSHDRIVLMVRDPYWLHTCWELTSRCVERATVALAENWHSAKPVLRLLRIDNANSSDCLEHVIREIEIHGAVRNWYIDVQDPPTTFRVEVGYLTVQGKFHVLARSNSVTTPVPGSSDMLDGNWADVADNCEKIYAMSGGYGANVSNGELRSLFEERLRRPMGSPMVTRFGSGAQGILGQNRDFYFDIDAEMIVYGITCPDAYVTMAGEPVKLRPDGTFTARVGLPERRQVIPVVASSSDGVEEQTIVLGIERNTKVMEPVVRDVNT